MSAVPSGRATYAAESEVSTATPQCDFFISYNAEDHGWAEWIAWVLEENGYATYIQEWDFRPGHNFVLMMQASTAARQTLLVLSESFLRSVFAQSEWAAAFSTDPTGAERRVIPVRVRPCQPDGLLRSIIHIDLVDCDETEAEQKLVRGVRAGRAKPSGRPAFPGIVKLHPVSAPGEKPR